MRLLLHRYLEIHDATVGVLQVPGLAVPIYTLEDGWKDNRPRVSCIPAGIYICKPHGWNGEPVKFERVWEVTGVKGRSAILFHAGNTVTDTTGCILVGLSGTLTGDHAWVGDSRSALNILRDRIGQQDFELVVTTSPALARYPLAKG